MVAAITANGRAITRRVQIHPVFPRESHSIDETRSDPSSTSLFTTADERKEHRHVSSGSTQKAGGQLRRSRARTGQQTRHRARWQLRLSQLRA